ncbi:Na+/H+ antiporter [Moraxella catarrhalis BC8]|nr:Na+/H+ antiporter [Moraxella catarrhalis BC8]
MYNLLIYHNIFKKFYEFFGYNTEFNFDRYDLGVMMNAVLLAVIVMVGLSLVRVHVVLSLVVGGTCWRFDGGYVGR